METVLVVDDEPTLREVVVRYLEREGYHALEAGDGEHAEALMRSEHPDLVILDLMLPGTDGLELCRRIRARSSLPVIMLTARGEETRVRTVLRRTAQDSEPREVAQYGDLVLDSASREVRKSGRPVKLTAKEFDLLWFLATHPRRVFSREHLMASVWGYHAAFDTGTVTVHIRRLRAKIEDDAARPRHIETVWGVGYRFSP
jgi:two-component system response regulator ResD